MLYIIGFFVGAAEFFLLSALVRGLFGGNLRALWYALIKILIYAAAVFAALRFDCAKELGIGFGPGMIGSAIFNAVREIGR